VAEERALIEALAALPLQEAPYKEYTAKRRIAAFDQAFPEFLQPLRARVGAWVGVEPERFRHGLATEYRPGTALGWHRDAPQYGLVVGVSLAAPCRMRFRPFPPRPGRREVLSLELAPRSAYVLRGDVRWRWQHGIPPTRALRYSLTFRTLA
jgi:alkylated DNA repair dioxygenase AlkB